MNEMFRGFGFIWAYIDYLPMITNVDWYNCLEKLELTLKHIIDSGLKCIIKNSLLGHTEVGYIGFWVNWNRIQPINKR